MDISDFEGADVIHDLNVQIPPNLVGQFDCVYDGGTIEHVYNFHAAITNAKNLLKIGGVFYFLNGANNMLGHGLYQFSSELLWRLFSPKTGFRVIDMALVENVGGMITFIDAPDPETLGYRNEISATGGPTYIMMAALKESDAAADEMFYQSDYRRTWAAHNDEATVMPDSTESSTLRSTEVLDRLMSNVGHDYLLDAYFSRHASSFDHAYSLCKPETGTSVERMRALFAATHYVIDEDIPGDFVECGVWRGGSSMLIAMVLAQCGVTDRKIWLYDTFEGMTAPTNVDIDFAGTKAADILEAERSYKETAGIWCYATFDVVVENMRKTGFPTEFVKMIKGPVEQTIPSACPERIALLRLDTDWYESTLHEMVHLYPRLTKEGVLIIDDYGHWQGCRAAIDQFFRHDLAPPKLHEIDYTGRLAVKRFSGAT